VLFRACSASEIARSLTGASRTRIRVTIARLPHSANAECSSQNFEACVHSLATDFRSPQFTTASLICRLHHSARNYSTTSKISILVPHRPLHSVSTLGSLDLR
jgi:hypothetical protein